MHEIPLREFKGRPRVAATLVETCDSVESCITPDVTSWMRRNRRKIENAPRVSDEVPVVCIGNIVVGGSGKSPLVISLALRLKEAGFRPGIVSRGYGGHVKNLPIEVTETSEPTPSVMNH